MDLIERSSPSARRHPWEVARARFFLRLLERWDATCSTRILDVGAGDAWFARQLLPVLPAGAEVTCWDINYGAEDLADSATSPGLVLTSTAPSGLFDGILMLDVIEHVEDDISFVRKAVDERLADGGWIVISVPAYQDLFTAHDKALHHFRRYSPRQCREVLREAGLTVEREGGLFHSLLAVRAALALRERMFGPGEDASHGIGDWQGGAWTTRLVTGALDAEGRLALAQLRYGVVLPGLSYWACCRRSLVD
jgi:SAM-dependent methyltransferase